MSIFCKIKLPKLLRQSNKKDETKPVENEKGSGISGISNDLLSKEIYLSKCLDENIRRLKTAFDKCSDIVFREFVFAQNEEIKLALVYIDGLADKNQVSDQIMRTLALEVPIAVDGKSISKVEALNFIKQRGLCIHQVKETNIIEDITNAILSGDTVLLVDGHSTAIINGARAWEMRAISEPQIEPVVRGPRESFVESLRPNTSLLRRKIKSSSLKMEYMKLGRVSNTDIVIAYIEGIVNEELVTEVKSRLSRIDIDAVLETSYIEELITDNPYSLFPLVNNTERPDRVAAMLLEGRVAILVDGTPFVLTVPTLMVEFLQSPEDYYENTWFATFIRPIRFFAALISLVLPSIYIAMVSYHNELLPTTFLLSIAAQRETVPFPVFVEVFIMELIFEVLREAGIRLPRPIGSAISIVGALVIGDAAVRAGLTAAATVIVVALTAISSFTYYYSLCNAFRILRFSLMIFAATLGLFGVISAISVIGVYLCTLRSFGVPYLAPVVPLSKVNLKDVIFRPPWWVMNSRPRLIVNKNQKRQKDGLKPGTPDKIN